MVKIEKLEEPQILKENADLWTREYLGYIQRGEQIPENVKKRYSHPDIKKRLLEETHGKCAYCESVFNHVEPGDIEHIKSKNKDAHPELYVTWSNLTMSCETCNRNGKGTYNDDTEPLINPYEDDIGLEIMGLGPMIAWKSRKGRITIDVLKLNRTPLVERRLDRIKTIELMRQRFADETNVSYKQILLSQIEEEIGKDKEYSFILQEYWKQVRAECK